MSDSQLPLSAARDRAIEELSSRFANDDLTLDELERRIERVYRASSIAEVAQLTADLRPLPARASDAGIKRDTPPSVFVLPDSGTYVSVSHPVEEDRIVAIMGESKRAGVWQVPRRLDVVGIMSDMTVDLTGAQLPTGVMEIHLRAAMASVKIVLPPGLSVSQDVTTIMASVTSDIDDEPVRPRAPRVG